MKIVFILNFILIASCANLSVERAPSSDRQSCESFFREVLSPGQRLFSPYMGQPYDHIYPISGHDVYRLGWGADADSLRIVPHDKEEKPFTRKWFRTDPDDPFYSDGLRDTELKRLNLVKELVDDCTPHTCFDLIKVIGPREEDLIDFDYIPGRTLEWLIKNEDISIDIRKSFQRKYKSYSLKMIAMIQKKYGKRAVNFKVQKWRDTPGHLPYDSYIITIVADNRMLKAGFSKETKIWLKPDNIIVNPDSGELTLIDPY